MGFFGAVMTSLHDRLKKFLEAIIAPQHVGNTDIAADDGENR